DIDAPAGRIAEARLLGEAHDGPRAAALRGRLARRDADRAHHLYAYRLPARGRERVASGQGRHHQGVRRAVRAREAASLQDALEGRAGGARGDPAHGPLAHADLREEVPEAGPAQAVHADLAAHARLADGAGAVREHAARRRRRTVRAARERTA